MGGMAVFNHCVCCGEIATVGLTSIWFAGGALGALLVSMMGLHPAVAVPCICSGVGGSFVLYKTVGAALF